MTNNKKLLLALALAISGTAAQAGNLDLKIPDSATAVTPPVNPLLAGAGAPAVAPTAAQATTSSPAAAQPKAVPAKPVAAPITKTAQKVEPASVQRPAPRAAVAEQPSQPSVKAEIVTPVVSKPTPAQSIAEPNKVVVGFGQDRQAAAIAAGPAPAAPIAAPAVQPSVPSTNPFTGKSLALESRQRDIEAAHLDTELLSERLKQAAMLADLTYLPVKKQAEVALLPNIQKAQSREAAPVKETPARAIVTPTSKKITKTKKKPIADAPVAPPVQATPAEPVLSVSSISINGSNASVVLEAQGNVMTAHQGESTPFGVVRVVDAGTVMVGGRQLKLRDAVISRMVVSDPPVVDPRNAAVVVPARTPTPTPTPVTLPPLPNLPPPPKSLSFGSK